MASHFPYLAAEASSERLARPVALSVQKFRRLLADSFASLNVDDPAAHRHLLFLRFALINLVAFGLLGAAWLRGWVDLVLVGDTTGLVVVIAAVFAFGLASCAHRVQCVSAELSQVDRPRPGSLAARYLASTRRRDGQSRALTASALKLELSARVAPIRHVATSLVFLGLIGTVIGFIIALSSVDPDAVADVSAIGPMVSTLISGMSVALYTTLIGAVLNIWLMLNYRLLERGAISLVTRLVEQGERDAQS